jgi:hypothetical protein
MEKCIPGEQRILPLWIVTTESKGEEWAFFRKKITLSRKPYFAEVLFSSCGVCGLYINGEFVESCTSRHQQGAENTVGRYHGRINRHEVTSRLMQGENLISFELGSSYFQNLGLEEYKRGGLWFSEVAAVLKIHYSDGQIEYIITDRSWKYSRTRMENWNTIDFDENGWNDCIAFRRVREREYDKFWAAAALWKEIPKNETDMPDQAIIGMFGEDYIKNIQMMPSEEIVPLTIIDSDIKTSLPRDFPKDNICIEITPRNDEISPFVVVDFGKLVVGYLKVEFQYPVTGQMRCDFDYSENIADFEPETKFHELTEKLAINIPLNAEMKEWFNIRRRAFRFLKISFNNLRQPVCIKKLYIKTSLYPVINKGWFDCSDPILNKIWDTGRYTLHVNMHQEYESCPRHEMLYFSGDGLIDALVDYYAYGDGALLLSSLSIIAPEGALGIVYDSERTSGMWDYYCWRIITIWECFKYRKDEALVKRFYGEAVNGIEWLIARMDERNLIYQLPVGDSVEWTCSYDRLGEKAFLNSLFYKSLLCMVELGDFVSDSQETNRWRKIAEDVKMAVNEFLWSDIKQAYIDFMYDYISQDGNALTVLFGVADKKRSAQSMDTLKEKLWSPYGSVMFDREIGKGSPYGFIMFDRLVGQASGKVISPLMCTYEAEADFLYGRIDDALTLIRRCWGTMIKKGAGTFWEYAYNDATTRWPIPSHAWSSGCTYLLSAYLLGVRPLLPGFEATIISPRLGDLEWVQGVVPVPQGLIGVKCERKTDNKSCATISYTILVPSGIKNTYIELPYTSSLKFNDVFLWQNDCKTLNSCSQICNIEKKLESLCISVLGSGMFKISQK